MTNVHAGLTARQRQVLTALERLTARDGFPPSLRELAREVGLASPSSVLRHVRVLEAAELVARRPGCPRAIRTGRRAQRDAPWRPPIVRDNTTTDVATPTTDLDNTGSVLH